MHHSNNLPDEHVLEEQETPELCQHALNALGERTAILDSRGWVLWTNRTWERYATRENLPPFVVIGAGVNYLEVCREASSEHHVAHDILYGIYSVLEGLLERFSLEYRLPVLEGVPGWYQMTACPIREGAGGLVLTHREITSQKLAEQERDRLNAELQYAMSSLHTLSTLLPVCGSCGRVRDDGAYQERVRAYFAEHGRAESFGMCPECQDKFFARPSPPPEDKGTRTVERLAH